MACKEDKDSKKDFLKEAEYALAENRRIFLWGPVEDPARKNWLSNFFIWIRSQAKIFTFS